MHRPISSSHFLKPGRSRPIPIVDPASGQPSSRSPPAQPGPQLGSSLPGSLLPGPDHPKPGPPPKASPPQSWPLAPSHATTRNGTAPSPPAAEADDEFARGFDVYATPFVPEKLRSINFFDGQRIDTPPGRLIDYGAYSVNALGTGLLPAVPAPDPTASESSSNSVSDQEQPWQLKTRNYERYFRRLLDAEFACQERENATYSLYAHAAVVDFGPPGEAATCTITVPGLSENSPYVEVDDVVELRQLRADGAGGLLVDRPEGSWAGVSASYRPDPWTETVFRARATAVLRAKETVVLRVVGLTHHSAELLHGHLPYVPLPAQARLRFNVQFPVPRERHLPMEHVLPQIQAALTAASDITYGSQDAELPGLPAQMNDTRTESIAQENQFWVQSMLFPTQADCETQASLHPGSFAIRFLDRAANWEQRKAVESICLQNYGVLPYLVSGPPGTGKTKTLIETALQLALGAAGASHVLVCAPSEPATDTLASRLRHHLKPHELLRLNRPSRPFAEVPGSLLPYCHIAGDAFALPPFAQLMRYRVVVTSCRDAAMLMYARMTNSDLYAAEYGLRSRIHPLQQGPEDPGGVRLHWDALLIDEAAQATEPQSLVPLFVVAPPRESPRLRFTPLVAMAGDEHQLGPRTAAASTPLRRSLFARLFALPVYAEHPLARGRQATAPPPLKRSMLPILRPAFTNLVHNYRSHAAILAVPSSLFYHDTLEAEAPRASTERLATWDGWRGRRWPVLFHHCQSADELERDAGGWYNAGEAEVACSYAARLAASGLVSAGEICVMSPFKAQVRRLRAMLRSGSENRPPLWDVSVGPTEAFQGLERGVVILCVTRARRRFVERDRSLGWGIVGMPNEMNVALTRAKFGLIIVGRRAVLREDASWRAVLAYCDRNGLVGGDEDGEGGQDDTATAAADDPDRLTRLEKMLRAADDGGSSDTLAVLGSRMVGDLDPWTMGAMA